MITEYERERLGKNLLNLQVLLDLNGLGYDCEGQIIKAGDKVVVVKSDSIRWNDPNYEFCNVGKEGIAVGKKNLTDFIHWFISIQFPIGNDKSETVGCVDYYLRKV